MRRAPQLRNGTFKCNHTWTESLHYTVLSFSLLTIALHLQTWLPCGPVRYKYEAELWSLLRFSFTSRCSDVMQDIVGLRCHWICGPCSAEQSAHS